MIHHLGDPAGMRAKAHTLRHRADALAALAESLQRQVNAMEFEGPAASRFRARMVGRKRRVQAMHAELHELAAYLETRAGGVEGEIADLRRREQAQRRR